MRVHEIMRQAEADGIGFRLVAPEGLKIVGKQDAVQRWLPSLKPYKPQILDVLLSDERQRIMGVMTAWGERAALMTNASTTAEQAEIAAWHDQNLDAVFFGVERLN